MFIVIAQIRNYLYEVLYMFKIGNKYPTQVNKIGNKLPTTYFPIQQLTNFQHISCRDK